ncbi:putative undecaprenyl-phosphate N-acetylglucosaminyl 1-phosphate transferase [Pigmentiphaga humi]|uniref:Putative undecaprenyl-phosphate N-acetylglucosaminyl 1-phosphate transferase n=1 Tax=Pigmentiphaga humi TaxID=2478468 RepID=A0A3P4B339_9BURK|nr:glycosyltransferase [Pigmentiphaga humi]VCU70120.1 putative undecaprenyl-phosphate N-acetylglucosaminyl 1-phosphate transferase [Pigmentiphaga humi]
MFNFACSFVISLLATALVMQAGRYSRAAIDLDMDGAQRFHARPVPRIGGIGLVVACSTATAALAYWDPFLASLLAILLFCSAMVFVAGLAEDLTKQVRPAIRLASAFASAGLAAALLQACITRVGIAGLDAYLALPLVGALAAVLCTAALVNAVNIIDGFNGLAGVTSLAMSGSLAYVALQVNDPFVLAGALILCGALLGFLVWNYPRGLVFLGDGGAYFVGFMLAQLGILLVARNPQVSAWYPALLFIYPIFETAFSIYRKKLVRGISPSIPDGMHLHMLIYKRVIRWMAPGHDTVLQTRRNAATSPYLWGLSLLSIVPATLGWQYGSLLAAFLALFIAAYLWLYTAIVRFRTPKWMVLRGTKVSQSYHT